MRLTTKYKDGFLLEALDSNRAYFAVSHPAVHHIEKRFATIRAAKIMITRIETCLAEARLTVGMYKPSHTLVVREPKSRLYYTVCYGVVQHTQVYLEAQAAHWALENFTYLN
jgi:hypothetical protein